MSLTSLKPLFSQNSFQVAKHAPSVEERRTRSTTSFAVRSEANFSSSTTSNMRKRSAPTTVAKVLKKAFSTPQTDSLLRQIFGLPPDGTVKGATRSTPSARSGSSVSCSRQNEQLKQIRDTKAQTSSNYYNIEETVAASDWRAVRFTAEKAKNLRKIERETTAWHDTMYHSGIAARLAES